MGNFWISLSILGVFTLHAWGGPSSAAWSCGEERWVGSPGVEDGIYLSTLTIDCQIDTKTKKGLSQLSQAIRNTMKEKSIIHSGPIRIRTQGLDGWSYEVTNVVKDSDDPVRITENVQIATDNVERLIYRTFSRKVEASGMAGYLRRVGFYTDLQRTTPDGPFKITMNNSVQVERPWYALPFLFTLIAKEISKDKFETARNKLLTYISENL